ncbi:MAG: AtpZ/AtpI family protein [Bryobacterales bacterium]|nr:AtpZ/AtpI family protein [Bryobacterales bacterium]
MDNDAWGESGKKAGKPASKPPAAVSERAQVWRQFAEYSGLAIAMPVATVIGFVAGRWLDGAVGTSFFWLIGLLLGIAAGFLQLIRKAVRDSGDAFK